jgi:hypothetical protein
MFPLVHKGPDLINYRLPRIALKYVNREAAIGMMPLVDSQ